MSENPIHRVVILGHTGFIGSQIARTLPRLSPGIEIVGRSRAELDATSRESMRALGALMGPSTAVIFCSGIKKQLGDSLAIFSQNMRMAENVCELLHEHPARRVIFFSSAEVYGPDIHNTAITEETPARALSYYGIAKLASEGILQKMVAANPGTSLAVLRPPLIYGVGDVSKGYGPTGFAWAIAEDREITLWGDGSELREFVSVGDLARIAVELVFSQFQGVLNTVTGSPHTFRETLDLYASFAPRPLRISTRPRSKGKVDQGYDNSLLRKVLPDFAFTPLADGLKQLLDDVQSS